MNHVIDSDWSLGSVHVTGAILLVNTGEDLHVWGMIDTCTQGGGTAHHNRSLLYTPLTALTLADHITSLDALWCFILVVVVVVVVVVIWPWTSRLFWKWTRTLENPGTDWLQCDAEADRYTEHSPYKKTHSFYLIAWKCSKSDGKSRYGRSHSLQETCSDQNILFNCN